MRRRTETVTTSDQNDILAAKDAGSLSRVNNHYFHSELNRPFILDQHVRRYRSSFVHGIVVLSAKWTHWSGSSNREEAVLIFDINYAVA